MKRLNALMVIGSISALSVVGCQEPGVTAVYPVPVTEATTGAGGSLAPANCVAAPNTAQVETSCACTCSAADTSTGGKTTAAQPSCTCTCGDTPTDTVVTTAAGSAGTTGKTSTNKTNANGATAGRAGTAGSIGSTGSKAGAGGSTGASGASGTQSSTPGPCPAGFTCTDLGSMGVKVTDTAGKVYQYSCGNNSLMDCTDANAATACTGFTAPFCATINVAGQDLRSCAQACTP
jgi:hypothetical protein